MTPPAPSGPDGPDFWAAVEPPQPDDATWDAVRRAIAARLPAPTPAARPRRRWAAVLAVAAGVALAAGLLWVTRDRPDVAKAVEPEPAPDVAVAPMPREVLPESEAMPAEFELAAPDEVTVVAVKPCPKGRTPDPKLCAQPGDAPVLYAGRP